MKPSRPPLRYYGSKWRIAPQIVALLPKHDVYVEPFGGSAAVLLHKPRSLTEIYNDLWFEAVEFFRVLRAQPEAVAFAVQLTPYSRAEHSRCYEPTSDPVEFARRFCFRAASGIGSESARRKTGFRLSLCDQRHNTASSWASWPDALRATADRLIGVALENKDAFELLDRYTGDGTVFYLDPPYLGNLRKQGTGYTHELMGEEQHIRLLKKARKLDARCLISGYESPLYDDLLSGWEKRTLKARDQANDQRTECVWMNYHPEPMLFA